MENLTREAIQNVLIQAIAGEMSLPENEIRPEMSLKEDLAMESLDAMNIIMALEEHYRVETDLEDILECQRISEIVDYMESFLKNRSAA